MKYQKIANLLENKTWNQPSRIGTKNWFEKNNESRGRYTSGYTRTKSRVLYLLIMSRTRFRVNSHPIVA